MIIAQLQTALVINSFGKETVNNVQQDFITIYMNNVIYQAQFEALINEKICGINYGTSLNTMISGNLISFELVEYVQDHDLYLYKFYINNASITPVNGGSGGTVTKETIGLGNVDNTADSTKPVSLDQKTYIDQQDNNLHQDLTKYFDDHLSDHVQSDIATYERYENKVSVESAENNDQYPTALSVIQWVTTQINTAIATLPQDGLKTPIVISLESNLPATGETGDNYIIQNMDVTSDGSSGRAWWDGTQWIKTVNQNVEADGVSIIISGTGKIAVSTSWLNNIVNLAVQAHDGSTTAHQTLFSQKLSLTGGTMLGELILSGDPTTELGAATRQFVINNLNSLTQNITQAINSVATELQNEMQAIIDETNTNIDTYSDEETLIYNDPDNQANNIYRKTFKITTVGTNMTYNTGINMLKVHSVTGMIYGKPTLQLDSGDFAYPMGYVATSALSILGISLLGVDASFEAYAHTVNGVTYIEITADGFPSSPCEITIEYSK